MKKSLVILSVLLWVFSCTKEGNQTTNEADVSQDTVIIDSTNAAPEISAPNTGKNIKPLAETASKNKIIFKNNQLIILSFDTQSQTGSIEIDNVPYTLDKLIFSENNYEISGKNIKIIAEDGNFEEPNSDCLTGVFPSVTITTHKGQIHLSNISVQDCSSL